MPWLMKWTAEDDAQLADMLSRNLNYSSIARLTGRTQDAVRGRVRHLRERDLLGERAGNWSDERDATLLRMLASGQTRGQVARHFQVSHHAVTRRLARLLEQPVKVNRGQPSDVARARNGNCTEAVDRNATRQFEKQFRRVAAKRGWAARVQGADGRWYLPCEQVAA